MRSSPPIIPSLILKYFGRFSQELNLLGEKDEEGYYLSELKGQLFARRWYWLTFIKILPTLIIESFIWRGTMIKNYLKFSLRSIRKNKIISAINIFGLTIGLTCSIFIFLWIQDELSYDSFHENSEDLVRLVQRQIYTDGTVYPVAVTSNKIGPALVEDYPQIIDCTRFKLFNEILLSAEDKKFYESGLCFADPSFFKMFSWKFIEGDPSTALEHPHSIVISESLAKKYFPGESSIGKTISLNNEDEFQVTGVIMDVPANSHLQFNAVGKFDRLINEWKYSAGWGNNNFYTYAQLQPGTSLTETNEEIKHYIKKIFEHSKTEFFFQPLKDVRLRSDFAIDLYGRSENSEIYITFFTIIALFVLGIACINFMNLTTAQSTKRLKEIGVRKVNGALRRDIAKQFFAETLTSSFISAIFACITVFLLSPSFNLLTEKSLNFHTIFNIDSILLIFAAALLIGVLSGIYPSIFISGFHPVKILKDVRLKLNSKSYFRRVLILTQFSLSIILIIATLVVLSQLEFMQNTRLGFDKDSIIYFRKRGGIYENYETFKSELKKNPNLINVTTSSSLMTYTVHSFGGLNWEGKEEKDNILIYRKSADYDFIDTFGMEIIEGRNFSREFAADAGSSFILNETAIKLMGLEDPIGKWMKFWGDYEGRIIGVVKDFNFKSLHEQIEPLFLMINPRWDNYVFVKLSSGNITASLETVEEVYKEFNSGYPFSFNFLDEEIDQLYKVETRTKNIFEAFTFLAIFVTSIGLLGLITFITEERTKEIGIRKVLGASITGIVTLISREIMIMITISNIIAWPIAYLSLQIWLEGFAYRTDITVGIFISAASLILLTAAITLIWKVLGAARMNPAQSLKYE